MTTLPAWEVDLLLEDNPPSMPMAAPGGRAHPLATAPDFLKELPYG